MPKSWKTKLIHTDAKVPEGFRSLNTPIYRGSTIVFPDAHSAVDHWDQWKMGYTYGLYGTPTTLELAARICELEGGDNTFITAGGQGALSLTNLSVLQSGDHMLLPENVYGPHRRLAKHLLRRLGVEASFYDPLVGAAISEHFRENTKLVWCESPGSLTMEVQDVPAIVKAAHARGILVAIDNTWSAGVLFHPFEHQVDISVQALTKYVGGHSDLLLGSVTVKNRELYEKLGNTHYFLGCSASPDDCSLALRGLKTMAVRLKQIEQSALAVAKWLRGRIEVDRVLHPALPSCPGYESWEKDFKGSSGLFSIVFKPGRSKQQVEAFVDALDLFEIGYSWGGVTSLAMSYDLTNVKGRPKYDHRLVRLYVGLEDTEDLIADLEQALRKMSA